MLHLEWEGGEGMKWEGGPERSSWDGKQQRQCDDANVVFNGVLFTDVLNAGSHCRFFPSRLFIAQTIPNKASSHISIVVGVKFNLKFVNLLLGSPGSAPSPREGPST